MVQLAQGGPRLADVQAGLVHLQHCFVHRSLRAAAQGGGKRAGSMFSWAGVQAGLVHLEHRLVHRSLRAAAVRGWREGVRRMVR